MIFGRLLPGRSSPWLAGLAAAALAFACADDDGTSAGVCTPGYVGCPCAAGVCLADLECVEDLCVGTGSTDGTDAMTTNVTHATQPPTSGYDDGQSVTGSDEPFFCEENADCPAATVCSMDSFECEDALAWSYKMTVDTWNPDGCAGLEQSDLHIKAKVNGVTQVTSGDSSCPGSWFQTIITVQPDWVVELELWNVDQLVTTFCFRDAADKCTTVPVGVLHDGGFAGPTGTSYLELIIYPDHPI